MASPSDGLPCGNSSHCIATGGIDDAASGDIGPRYACTTRRRGITANRPDSRASAATPRPGQAGKEPSRPTLSRSAATTENACELSQPPLRDDVPGTGRVVGHDHARKLGARGHAELAVDAAQVVFDSSWAKEQLRGDVAVGEPVAHETSDLCLLRGERAGAVGAALAGPLAG